jgi:hypothetical protein
MAGKKGTKYSEVMKNLIGAQPKYGATAGAPALKGAASIKNQSYANSQANFAKIEKLARKGGAEVADDYNYGVRAGAGYDVSSPLINKPNQKAFLYIPAKSGDDLIYTNFILETIGTAMAERYTIMETFTTSFVSFYGKRPEIYNITASVYDCASHPWADQIEEFYSQVGRGTQALFMEHRVYLYYDGRILEGYMLGFSKQKSANEPFSMRISFSMLKTNLKVLSLNGESGSGGMQPSGSSTPPSSSPANSSGSSPQPPRKYNYPS